MGFAELAANRYSLRKMDENHEIEHEKLEQIIATARVVPSACNLQRHRIKMITTRENILKLRECTKCHFNAPTVAILSLDNDTGSSPMNEDDGYKFGMIDIGIVAAHITLQAAELGIGSTIVGMFDEQKLREQFAIPDTQTPVLLIPMGYPDIKGGPCILHKSRLSIDKTVEWL